MGRWLAETTYVIYPSSIGFGSLEVRLVAPRAAVRQVAQTFIGLSCIDFVGPSFEGGGLFFAKTCHGECAGRSTVYRYGLRDGVYRQAGGTLGVYGFARDRGRHCSSTAVATASAAGRTAWHRAP